MEIETEEWRPVPKHPGCLISNQGRFRKENGNRIFPQNRSGYFVYNWKMNRKQATVPVAKVMAEVWPEISQCQFSTVAWVQKIRAENVALVKVVFTPGDEEATSWGPIDFYQGCKSPDSPEYCPLG